MGIDKSYWSAGPRDEPGYASQQTMYEDMGVELLDHSFEGFNTCIFACKHTIWLLCNFDLTESLFRRSDGKVSCCVKLLGYGES